MYRFSILLIALLLIGLIGCASEETYKSHMKNTQASIEECAMVCYDVCAQNQIKAIESSVITRKMGKPILPPGLVDKTTRDELDNQWMQVQMQFAALKDPPKSCVQSYGTITKMYEACQKLHQLAMKPTGMVEAYQVSTDVLYEVVGVRSSELNALFAGV